MRYYDISLGISPDLPVWPDDPPVVLERIMKLEEGAEANVSRLACGVHVGTHVDAPLHFLEGAESVDRLSLRALIGRVYVVHLPQVDVLDAKTLQSAGIPPRTRRVLFKTRNSSLWGEGVEAFREDYVAIDASGARWLTQKGLQLVGVDYLSVAPYERPQETHQILLGAGIIVVEGLNLNEVRPGRYTIYCLPIKLIGCEGAPARVILQGV
jgi:arylformamidase